eukprot:m.356942 g.356942  ORF g.356942 m.356942 type:complete len:593 (+) comp17670_c0_seq1:636-2414(+)
MADLFEPTGVHHLLDGVPVHHTEPKPLPSEPQEGNIEYKLKLVDISDDRLIHLCTQMKWRLAEGGGEAIYQIGVCDNGALQGLSTADMKASLHTLARMAEIVGGKFTLLSQSHSLDGKGHIAEVHVRRAADDKKFVDVRVVLLGASGCGKSTILGCLSSGHLDCGQGSARLGLFRHNHEVITGQTSSLSTEVLAFDDEGHLVNYDADKIPASSTEMFTKATKLVHVMDTPGCHKYEKTTLLGVTGGAPDYICFVSSSTSFSAQAQQHLSLALALDIPLFVVISKADKCTKVDLKRTLTEIIRRIKTKKVPLVIRNEADVVAEIASRTFRECVPIFVVSSVSGKNLGLLTKFLNLIPPHRLPHGGLCVPTTQEMQRHALLTIEETFMVSKPDGTFLPVVAGQVKQGVIRVGDSLSLGPDAGGSFSKVSILNIHRNHECVSCVQVGEIASFAVNTEDARPGQVLCAQGSEPVPCTGYTANVVLLGGCTTDQLPTEARGFVGAVRQAVRIDTAPSPAASVSDIQTDVATATETVAVAAKTLDDDVIRVHASFLSQAAVEVVRVGTRVVFQAANHFKAVGTIVSLDTCRHSQVSDT